MEIDTDDIARLRGAVTRIARTVASGSPGYGAPAPFTARGYPPPNARFRIRNFGLSNAQRP